MTRLEDFLVEHGFKWVRLDQGLPSMERDNDRDLLYHHWDEANFHYMKVWRSPSGQYWEFHVMWEQDAGFVAALREKEDNNRWEVEL